jgi:hypothetical protein
MTRPTPGAIKALRARAIAAGIDWDNLSPLLRVSDVVRSPKGRKPSILPVSARTWFDWVAQGLVPQPIKFDNGVSAWLRDDVIRIALDGLYREPGHGRKLPRRQLENIRPRRKSEGEPEAFFSD